MKHLSLLYSFLYITFTIAIPPQNEADRRLLCACKRKDEFDIAQALCLDANKEVIDERGRNLSQIITEYTPYQSIDLADMARFSELALDDYPRKLINIFEFIDKGKMPSYGYLLNELRLGIVHGVNYHGDTIVHRAIRNGQSGDQLVKKIVRLRGLFNWNFKAINIRNLDGDTPLHLVMKSSQNIRSEESRRRMSLFLISRGADAALKNKAGDTPITFDPVFWLSLCSSGIQQAGSKGFYSRISQLLFCRKKTD